MLALATCDQEISNFAKDKGCPVIQTAANHTRTLDRITEAASKFSITQIDDDIVVCEQGNEPLFRPDM